MSDKEEVLNKRELQDIANMMMQVTVHASSIEQFLQLKNKVEAMVATAPEAPEMPPTMPPPAGQQ